MADMFFVPLRDLRPHVCCQGWTVRASMIRGVSASVASFAVIAVTVGVLMWTPWLASGANRTVMFSLVAFMLPLTVRIMSYPRLLLFLWF